MANYSTIKGFEIQTIAGDPANPVVGQVWYDSGSNDLQGYGKQELQPGLQRERQIILII